MQQGLLARTTFSLIIAMCLLTDSAQQLYAADCGDFDSSGRVDITDVVYFINYIFAGGPAPVDDAGGDIDCSRQTDITDAVFFINYIFASGSAPCQGPLCESGVMLPGSPNDDATLSTYKFGPIAAGPSQIDSSGMIRSRIDAVLNPDATVGEVNAAVASVGGSISWMVPGVLSVTIAIPPVSGKAESDSIATLLVQSGAFLTADPAFEVQLHGSESSLELPPSGDSEIDHLKLMRMPAAWNVKKLVEDVNSKVVVYIPDAYYNVTPLSEIPSQSFISGKGKPTLAPTTESNHGFCTSGIVGARYDDKNATGVHPGPEDLLDIRSLMIGGLSVPEVLSEIADKMPSGRFVLNTSLGSNNDLTGESKTKRAIQALAWRDMVRSRKNDFVHISSAGNVGQNTDDSRYAAVGSWFNVSAAFDSPFEMFAPGEIGPVDNAVLTAVWAYYSQNPFNTVKTDNLIAVGSSNSNGDESYFSNVGSLVRALGVDVAAPCVRNDSQNEPGACTSVSGGFHISHYSGTSFSAPQVAGLAAYMLNLDPTLSNDEIKNILYNSFMNSSNPGFVDAYLAVLSLDKTMAGASVRRTLLDVANSSDDETPDDQFDEHDITMFLSKFSMYEQLRLGVPNAPADYSRFDLNGDGFTGGDDLTTRFDLDINDPPQYTTVTIDFDTTSRTYDETFLADLDILCYYANTPLYDGDADIRDSLMFHCPNCGTSSQNVSECGEPLTLITRLIQQSAKACHLFKDQPQVCPVDSLFTDRDSSDFQSFNYEMPVRDYFYSPVGDPDSTVLLMGADTHVDYDSALKRAEFALTSSVNYRSTGFLIPDSGYCVLYSGVGSNFVYYTFDVGAGYEGLLTIDAHTELTLGGYTLRNTASCSNRLLEIGSSGNIVRFIDTLSVTFNTTDTVRQSDRDSTLILQTGRYVIIRQYTQVGSPIGACAPSTASATGYLNATLQLSYSGANRGKKTSLLPKTISIESIESVPAARSKPLQSHVR